MNHRKGDYICAGLDENGKPVPMLECVDKEKVSGVPVVRNGFLILEVPFLNVTRYVPFWFGCAYVVVTFAAAVSLIIALLTGKIDDDEDRAAAKIAIGVWLFKAGWLGLLYMIARQRQMGTASIVLALMFVCMSMIAIVMAFKKFDELVHVAVLECVGAGFGLIATVMTFFTTVDRIELYKFDGKEEGCC